VNQDYILNEVLNFTLQFESKYYLSNSKLYINTIEESYKGVSRIDHPNEPIWSIIDEYKYKLVLDNNFDIENNTVNDYFLNNQFRWTDLFILLKHNDNLNLLIYNFYKNNFWDILNLLDLNDQLRKKFFDLFVSLYIANTSRLIQRTINQIYNTGFELSNNILDQSNNINLEYNKILKEISDNYIKTDSFLNVLCENQKNIYIRFCNKHAIYKFDLDLFIKRSLYKGIK
jgi:hypothetical protein